MKAQIITNQSTEGYNNNVASTRENEMENHSNYQNPLDTLNKTFNLLNLPVEVAENSKMLSALNLKMDAIQQFVTKFSENLDVEDRYLTPEEAMNYLGMSRNTFDKYRYSSAIKIKGCKLDGTNRYKKSDLDRFMLTYEIKSSGLA